ncbi:hypothetical protein ES695_17890 [Candidatus Atribacteria bacterium 1244-E10-H5-B2]|nr:MAG: hypothetical protein ES695_17890 [Candidatus Atribacteria bacterium 1244-E10-H5-B2]
MINIKDERVRNYLILYKRIKGCQFCGYKKCTSALDFHHIGGGKEFNISQSSNLEKIKEEVEKCAVLCKNCHAELHEIKEVGSMAGYNKINTKELEKVLLILTGQER